MSLVGSGVSALRLPRDETPPLWAVLRRVLIAFGLLGLAVLTVFLDRHGYADNDGNGVGLLDAVYYATVSLSTTGYGDIAPLTQQARLINVLVVTPLRVLFLIVLVGTTLEVLTERTREQYRQNRWKAHMQAHTVVVGYGTKGRSAVRALLADGYPRDRIVVVDGDPGVVAEANADGIAAVLGDATRRAVLEQARVRTAERVLVSSARDDTAILVVLTVRQMNPGAPIVSAVRESENAPLLEQSGATSVVVSSEAAGRLLAVAAVSPATGKVVEDLLVSHAGLELNERAVTPDEVGRAVRDLDAVVLAVLRGGRICRYASDEADLLLADDRLVVVRDTGRPHRD
ncbi:MAG: ion channel rane protein [Frankiales bacterium]|nr:ion channel rane protein [Frankiales bacterium]